MPIAQRSADKGGVIVSIFVNKLSRSKGLLRRVLQKPL